MIGDWIRYISRWYTFYDSEIGLEMYEKVIYNIVQDDQIALYRMVDIIGADT